MQSVHRLVDITIAKACITIFYEAPCVMAGVSPIGIVIAGTVRLCKRKVGLERIENPCDFPPEVNELLHTAQCVIMAETSELTTYSIENYADGSKDAGKVGARVAIYSKKQLLSQCK